MPYRIMLSSLIFARYVPRRVSMINVMTMQRINASSIEIIAEIVKKNGETTIIAAKAGEISSTRAAKIVSN